MRTPFIITRRVLIRLCICTLFALTMINAATAKVEFNYQGQISVQGVPFNGQGKFKLAIVNQAGNVSLWSNNGTSQNGSEPTDLSPNKSSAVIIPVIDGIFNIVVGDKDIMDPLPAHIFNTGENVYLRVWFNDGTHGFQMLQPDRRITNTMILGQISGEEDVVIFVNGNTGDDENAGLDPNHPKKTIQGAVNMAPRVMRANTTIRVAAGTYREQVNIFGISVAPGKEFCLLGDPDWTTTSTASPTVRITGSDDEVTSGVRDHGIIVQQASNVRVEGFFVDKTVKSGILVIGSSGILINRCKVEQCSQGAVPYRGGIETASSAINESSGGIGINLSNAKVFNCAANYNRGTGIVWDTSRGEEMNVIASHNSDDGTMLGASSTVWFFGKYLADRNGGDGIGVLGFSNASFIQYYQPIYNGTYTNNGQHGISVGFMALATGTGTGQSYSGNTNGNLHVEPDSHAY